MISVGVRDLKNQLSQYLQYVKQGETVLITEHNRIIAEITLPKEDKSKSTIEEKLDQLAISRKIIRTKRNRSITPECEISNSIDWISIYKVTRDER